MQHTPDAAGLSPDELDECQRQYEQVLEALHTSLKQFDDKVNCAAMLSALTTLLVNVVVRAEVPLDEVLTNLRSDYQSVLEMHAARPVA